MKKTELRKALLQSIKRQGWTMEEIKEYFRFKGVKLTKRLLAEIEDKK